MKNSFDLTQADQNYQLEDLKTKIEALAVDNSVLRRLYFDDMYKREDTITNATEGTFDWLLTSEDPPASTTTPIQTVCGDEPKTLRKWREEYEHERRLQSAANISDFLGHDGGVFFLRGKPGSGKSTLMKYLTVGRGKQKVDQKLRKWTGEKNLIRVSTMFLLHGSPLQRSLEGFYRTFFFELFCQCPDLVDILFPDCATPGCHQDSYRSSLRLEALQGAWERFLSIRHHAARRICLFVDGLDELEGNSGDRLRFARTLSNWAESDDIKLICSGRPNAEFNMVFDQPHRIINLQDLTKADIREILMKRFEEVRDFSDLTVDNIEEIANEISDQSEGVILWAVLVGRNLEDDIIHGKHFTAMKRTIQTLPPGIEDLFNGMWQDIRHDAHQQLMLGAIYDLLTLYDGQFQTLAVSLFWLEDALSDENFPYNEPIRELPDIELNSRLDKVRGQMIQYTKHFVEVYDGNPDSYSRYPRHYCRFIHRSAQDFIQSKLGLVESVPARRDRAFDLDLRLSLKLQLSVKCECPDDGFVLFYTRPFQFPKTWKSYQQDPAHQIQYRLMEKLHELMEARRELLSAGGSAEPLGYTNWIQSELRYDQHRHRACNRRRGLSILHIALRCHQVDYVTRMLTERAHELDRDALNIGALTCVAGLRPNYELFELLLCYGADPDSMVEVYRSAESTPDLLPLWLLFCFTLALQVSGKSNRDPDGWEETDLSDEFSILERFLCLGHGANVKFLAAAHGSSSEPDEDDLIGIDLAQVVRLGNPHNMDRLLSLLESPPATYFSLVQGLTNFVLQPHLPLRDLPLGATIAPYRRVSDEHLSGKRWDVWVAFDGEHEVQRNNHYYTPG